MTTTTTGGLDVDLTEFARALTPEELMVRAAEGLYSKTSLAALLTPEGRHTFRVACAAIEKKLTDECAAKQAFCIGTRCAVEGEVCLEAVLSAGTDYYKACGVEWAIIFADPNNRTDV